MNLELLESFGQNYPEEFDGALDSISLAATCAFNRRGTLLAVGCNDGRIFIWDFLTRGIAKSISAHVYPVCSLSWSRNCKKLLSASTDHNVCIWDVLSGECEQRYRFPTPIVRVQFDPRNDRRFLVCPMRHAALLVDTEGEHKILPIDDDGDINVIASFDRRGDYVYTGNAKGKILILDSQTLAVKASFKITVGTSSTTGIKSIEFARRGDCFLVNTSDRVIRVYDTNTVLKCGTNGEPEPIQKLQDLVNNFCSSDEEGEDETLLSFLPIAPEIEDPEDGWAATQETVTPVETPEKLEPVAKRPKSKTYDISLKIPPPEQTISFGGKNKQAAGNKKVPGRPRK
ncbi:PREDICTED: retinoblastoma-binding protein 5 homolog [Papilio polytes]|uniref:retinoblastoma-binding protein 5 homolog n=1 Tax=Papilio polytes TaxID=76194 RepID=UPI000675D5E2|nr:PREDICTED: retinoblastoma-binding protein 5 homolog [Papilio polytes]